MIKNFILSWRNLCQILATTFVVVLPSIGVAESLGTLNNTQIQSLKTLGIPVAIPEYIPPGFRISKFTVKPSPTSGRSSYQILYQNSDNSCFYISGFIGGLGGPEAEYLFPIETALFGKITINIGAVFDDRPYNQIPSANQLNSPQSEIWGFAVKNSVIYGVGTEEKQEGCQINQTITPVEIEKILKSMIFL